MLVGRDVWIDDLLAKIRPKIAQLESPSRTYRQMDKEKPEGLNTGLYFIFCISGSVGTQHKLAQMMCERSTTCV